MGDKEDNGFRSRKGEAEIRKQVILPLLFLL